MNLPNGNGDFEDLETLSLITVGGSLCKYPIDVEFRYSGSSSIILDENEKVISHNNLGVICLENNLDPSENCLDYEVRFLCRCNYQYEFVVKLTED